MNDHSHSNVVGDARKRLEEQANAPFDTRPECCRLREARLQLAPPLRVVVMAEYGGSDPT
jgi:hypothetical protein